MDMNFTKGTQMNKGTRVLGQYRNIPFSGVIGFVDMEDYGIILDKPITVEGVIRSKILVPKYEWKRASKRTFTKPV